MLFLSKARLRQAEGTETITVLPAGIHQNKYQD